MEQKNETLLSCSDMESMDRIMAERWESLLSECYEVNCSPGKPVVINSRYRAPWREIAQMSKENSELLFTAEFGTSPEINPAIRIVEFKNGVFNEVAQKPNYTITFYPPQAYRGKPFFDLMKQAEDIFNRTDTVMGVRGTMEVDMIICPIRVSVENEKYQLKVLKQGSKISVDECYKRKPGISGKWNDIQKELKNNISI